MEKIKFKKENYFNIKKNIFYAINQFSDRCYFDLQEIDNDIVLNVSLKEGGDELLEKMLKDFKNEIFYQELRSINAADSKLIREYVLERAILGAVPKTSNELSDILEGDNVSDNPLDELK